MTLYKTTDGTTYSTQGNELQAQIEFDDLVNQGLAIVTQDIAPVTFSWLEELTNDELVALYAIVDPDTVDIAKEEYEEFEEETTNSIAELVDTVCLEHPDGVVNDMNARQLEQLANTLTSVWGFNLTGYSQGDALTAFMPKTLIETFNNKEQAETLLQTVIYDGYTDIVRVDDDEIVDTVNTLDVETLMTKKYNATQV